MSRNIIPTMLAPDSATAPSDEPRDAATRSGAARQRRPARVQRRALPRVGHRVRSSGRTSRDLELIVCDNASTDRTGEICEEYARRDARVRYFRNPRNLGAGPNYDRCFAPRARRVLQVDGARRPPRAGLPVPHGRRAGRGAGGGAVHDRGGGDRPRRPGAPRLPQRLPRDRRAGPGAPPRRPDPHPPRVRGLLRPVPARGAARAPACTGPTAARTGCCWRRWRCAALGSACRSRCSCTASTRGATRAPCCCGGPVAGRAVARHRRARRPGEPDVPPRGLPALPAGRAPEHPARPAPAWRATPSCSAGGPRTGTCRTCCGTASRATRGCGGWLRAVKAKLLGARAAPRGGAPG